MKILIPVDGSDCAIATVEWAANTLDKNNTRYYVLSVIPDPMIAEYEIEDASIFLNEARGILEQSGCMVEKTEYLQGDPIEMICRYADDIDADQVLMGSHGRGGVAKFFLGSVSTAVLERCHKPVFLYRNVERKAGQKVEHRAPTFYTL